MGDSSASDSSALSKHEVQHEDYRRLSAQALMACVCRPAQRTVFARAETFARAQTNARFWLSQFSSEPLPEESEVTFEGLTQNGKLLSQVGAALVKCSQQGLAVVPALQMRAAEAWEAPVGAARAGRVADDAAAFIAACRTLGVRSVECCSALDITHPGPSSARAVRAGFMTRFRHTCSYARWACQVCVTLYALSARCKALGLRVAPFPVADLSFPNEDTKCARVMCFSTGACVTDAAGCAGSAPPRFTGWHLRTRSTQTAPARSDRARAIAKVTETRFCRSGRALPRCRRLQMLPRTLCRPMCSCRSSSRVRCCRLTTTLMRVRMK